MSTATYKTIPALIATRTPYKHGSSFATLSTYENKGVKVYSVYSYSTEIARFIVDYKGNEIERSVSNRKYSMTTSRLQNIIRNAWGLN